MATTKMAAPNMTATTTITQLRVSTSGSPSTTITIESGATIGQLKQKLFEITKIPMNSQTLVFPGFKDDDDSRIVNKVFPNKTSLHVSPPPAQPGSSQEQEEGHKYEDTEADNSHLQQGYQVDKQFHGQDPENRANHKYKQNYAKDGILKQGDHYIASKQSGSLAPDNVQQFGSQNSQQGQAYLKDQQHGSNAPLVKNSGNHYINTTATETDQRQGDKIYADSNGFVPRGAKGGTFTNTKSQGGSLHQGNTYGSD